MDFCNLLAAIFPDPREHWGSTVLSLWTYLFWFLCMVAHSWHLLWIWRNILQKIMLTCLFPHCCKYKDFIILPIQKNSQKIEWSKKTTLVFALVYSYWQSKHLLGVSHNSHLLRGKIGCYSSPSTTISLIGSLFAFHTHSANFSCVGLSLIKLLREKSAAFPMPVLTGLQLCKCKFDYWWIISFQFFLKVH